MKKLQRVPYIAMDAVPAFCLRMRMNVIFVGWKMEVIILGSVMMTHV